MSAIVINPYAFSATQYNRTPLKMLKAIPAGFPLPLHGDMFDNATHLQAIFDNIQSGGEDLRAFTDEAMTSEIPIEVISVTTASDIMFGYVRVPSALAINDKIYLRTTVGGGETAYAVTDTNGRNNVWQDYEIVCHGDDLTVDASGNQTDGTATGTASKSGADLLNGWPATGFGAREGSASTDRINFDDPPTYSTVCAEFVMFYKDATEDNNFGRIVDHSTTGANNNISKESGDEMITLRACSGDDQRVRDLASAITDGAWHGFGAAYPALGTNITYRHNGGTFSSPVDVAGTGSISSVSGDWVLGNTNAGNAPMDGRIAEYRYRADNTPDATWIDLEYDTFNDPGSIAEAEALVVV